VASAIPVLAHIDRARAALREKLFKLLLVKLDDQVLSSRPKGLIFALQYLHVVEEDSPRWSRHLIFH